MTIVAISMPRMGVSVEEAQLLVWHKQPGDTVGVGDAICDVATDKVDTSVESSHAGVLVAQLVDAGEMVAVGAALATVEAANATEDDHLRSGSGLPVRDQPAVHDPARLPLPAQPPRPQSARSDRSASTAPHERRAPSVHTSVTRFDHVAAAQRLLAGRTRTPDTAALATDPVGPPPGYEDIPFDVVAASPLRRATAEHMTRSRHTAAHMTTEVDVDFGCLSNVRAAANETRAHLGMAKLSYLPFIVRAACVMLRSHPEMNATFQTTQLVRWKEINMGIAVDTKRGLVVPVVKHCDTFVVDAIADKITTLAARARDRTITTQDMTGATFTISNPGSIGAVTAPAIINQPQVCILGIPAIVRRPWIVTFEDGAEGIAIRPIVRLALTFDHRAVDGAQATRFLVDLRQELESWTLKEYR